MDQSQIDQTLSDVLLHASKTKAYLKRLKASDPEKWRRVYRNVASAYEELNELPQATKYYYVGIYDPKVSHSWPWEFHLDKGVYISPNYRKCRWKSAAKFNTANEARLFFHQWKNKQGFKMKLLEVLE